MRIVVVGQKEGGTESLARMLASEFGLKCVRLTPETLDSEHTNWCVVWLDIEVLADPKSRRQIRTDSILVLVRPKVESLLFESLEPFADVVAGPTNDFTGVLAEIRGQVLAEVMLRSDRPNSFGEIIRITTFGESHGPAIGVVLDGLRPGIEITREEIQAQLDRRKPGQSNVTTPRKEADTVEILSGIFEAKTTGAPICMMLRNKDADSSKYEALKDVFRPGHADFTYYSKYGIRDFRGGGRSSGRETAGRVAAGAITRKILASRGVSIWAHAVEIAGIKAETCNYSEIESNPVRCADPKAASLMESAIVRARESNDSVGGIIRLDVLGVPPGLGDPVFFKLDARLAYAIMTLGAVKGVEIGDGFSLASMRGSESNDAMSSGGFLSNHAGGITGGISTGQMICLRAVVKPTSSIARQQKTVDKKGVDQSVVVYGRHDPCIVPRIIPVVEGMAALVLLDAWEVQARLRPDWLEHRIGQWE